MNNLKEGFGKPFISNVKGKFGNYFMPLESESHMLNLNLTIFITEHSNPDMIINIRDIIIEDSYEFIGNKS